MRYDNLFIWQPIMIYQRILAYMLLTKNKQT